MTLLAQFGAINYTVLAVYFIAMIAVGVMFSRKQHTTDDYFLAGRKMPWMVVGMSMFASLTSAISYLGAPATAYKENISMAVSPLIGIVVAPVYILIFYPCYRMLRVTTSYEYVQQRYGSSARYCIASFFILARMGWLATVIFAPAMVLSVVTGIPLWLCIIMMGVLATAYTVLGGLSAVLWTDVLQFIVLVVGAVWVAISLTNQVPDGFSGITKIASDGGKLQMLSMNLDFAKLTALTVLISYFFQFMNDYGVDQVTVQRLMSVPNYRSMTYSAIFNVCSDLFIMVLLTFIGIALFAFYAVNPELLDMSVITDTDKLGEIIKDDKGNPIIKYDRILPFYILTQLPAGISGLVITAIFAAAMSSMDSGINSLATVITNDFIQPLSAKNASSEQLVKLARIMTIALGAFATAMAFVVSSMDSILQSSAFFLGLFGGPVLSLFLLGMLTRRMRFEGWVVGAAVAVPVTFYASTRGLHFINYFPLCFSICSVLGYIVSLWLTANGKPLADLELTIWGGKFRAVITEAFGKKNEVEPSND